jgi:parvulin-like peptidyl-prolyl isomerase
MMQTMRNSAKIIFFIVLVTFLGFMAYGGLVSIISGRQTSRGQGAPAGVIGVVNGEDLSMARFEEEYRNRLQTLSTDDHEPTDAEMEQARTEIWNNLTTMALIEQEAAKHGILVSDKEVADYMRYSPPRDIVESPELKTEGQFDIGKYQMWLQQLALSPDPRYQGILQDLERQIRNQLLLARVQDIVLSTVKISKIDAERDFIEKNEKVKVRYIFIPSGDFDSTITTVPESEVRARYEKDREQYKQQETAVLDYVILPKNMSADDSAVVRKEIFDIYGQIQGGADFAELATALSQDPGSAKNGGDLGWFAEGRMVAEFWNTAASLKNVGDISQPFTTQFGWHIIKLTGKRTTKDDKGVEKPEVQASHILITAQPSEATLATLEQKAQNFKIDAEKLGFKEAASEYGLTVNETKPFVRGAQVPGIGQFQNLNDFSFNGKIGEISDLISARNGFYVSHINRRIPEGISPFEELKQRIEAQVLREKRTEIAHKKGEELAVELTRGKTLDDIAAITGKLVIETDYFTRSQFVPKIGSDADFIGASFALSPANPISKTVKARTGAYLVQYINKLPVDMNSFTAISDSLVTSMVDTKNRDLWNKWLNSLKQNAKIEDYRVAYYGS